MRGKKPRLYNSHQQGQPANGTLLYTIRRSDTAQFYAGERDGILWETCLDRASGYDTIGSAIAKRHELLRMGIPVYVAYDGVRI